MSFTYKKIEQILGPLLFLKNKHKVKYGEIVISVQEIIKFAPDK